MLIGRRRSICQRVAFVFLITVSFEYRILSSNSVTPGKHSQIKIFHHKLLGQALQLRGGQTVEVWIDDKKAKIKQKKILRSKRMTTFEKKELKKNRRKDRKALIISENIEKKQRAKLLSTQKVKSSESDGECEAIDFDRRGRLVPANGHRRDDGTLAWDDEYVIAKHVGDGEADWRTLQSAVARRGNDIDKENRRAEVGDDNSDDAYSAGFNGASKVS
jgi:hypothetical protein